MRCFGAAGLVVLLVAGRALADEADCRLDNAPGARRADVALARVGPAAPRLSFVKDGSDAKGCPDATPACRARAYLVPGDRVILGAARGAFVCASYLDAKGGERSGWLPAAALAREDAPPVAPADWFGTWTRTEATITLKAGGKGGEIDVRGEATYGALDPGRVRRGAVNVGEIVASRAPDGAALRFTVGETETLAIDAGDEIDCRVWMRRLGPYLLVDDNRYCGGANVSFAGVFARMP